jgi:hypothetical protein
VKRLRFEVLFACAVFVLCECLRSTPAFACPLCHSELGEQVRAAIFGPDLGFHLFAVLAPFPIFAAIIFALGRGQPFQGGRARIHRPPQE